MLYEHKVLVHTIYRKMVYMLYRHIVYICHIEKDMSYDTEQIYNKSIDIRIRK